MKQFYANRSICLIAMLGLWSTLSAQQLSNWSAPSTEIFPQTGDFIAQGFTTGPTNTYQTITIAINFSFFDETISIREDNNGAPGNLVGNINWNGFEYVGNVTLQPSTKYYLHINVDDNLGGAAIDVTSNLTISTSEGFTADEEYFRNSTGVSGQRLRFELTASNPLLPVELTAFNAFKKDTEVALQWETAAEINNEGFAIERSADGRSWESLDFVSGHGTTEQAIRYQWMDEQPLRGHNYYRLKQMDFDGKFEYSPVVQVDFSESGDFEVFPNPATEVLQYQLGAEQEVQRLQVYGQDGRLFHESERIDGQLDLSNFPAGRYILRLITAKGSMQKTFIVR